MKSIEIYIVFLIIYGESVTSNPLGINAIWNKRTTSNISPEKLACLLNIIHQEVECQKLFTILHQSNYGHKIIENLNADNCYNFVVRTPMSQEWLLRPEGYIILAKNITELTKSIDNLSKDFGWNARAKFFIIIPRLENFEYLELFRVLASLKMYHVRVISSDLRAEIYVYTYDPFEKELCGRVDKDVIKKTPCKDYINNEQSETEIENKIRHCTISVLAVEKAPNVIFKTDKRYINNGFASLGIDQYMLNNIAKRENYSFLQYDLRFTYRNFNITKVTDKCNSSYLSSYLSEHPLGISIGGYTLTKKGLDCLDYMWGYSYSNFRIYTAVLDIDHWRIAYQVFGITTWFLIAISFCLVTSLSIIIYKISVGKMNNKHLVLIIWAYINSYPDKELIKIRKLKVIIITWMWFSFFIVNFYNTAYYTLLTAPDNRGRVLTPQQILASPLKPCIGRHVRLFFRVNLNTTIPSIDTEDCLNENSALNAVAANKDFYTLVNEPSHYKRENQFLDNLGHPKLERWLFGTTDFPMIIFASKGFPLFNKFQRYAWYHFESGLLLRHTLDLNYHHNKFSEFEPLTLTDFKVHFSILFIGYTISIIAYVIEINRRN